jgi:hypothetical protein
MAAKKLLWVDIGMVVAAGGFVGLVLFLRNTVFFTLLIVAYMGTLIVWAAVAEVAANKSEVAEQELLWGRERQAAPTNEMLPH